MKRASAAQFLRSAPFSRSSCPFGEGGGALRLSMKGKVAIYLVGESGLPFLLICAAMPDAHIVREIPTMRWSFLL